MRQSLAPLATIRCMKLQFSLATLLVCTTVLGVVCAFAISCPVNDTEIFVKKYSDPHTFDRIQTLKFIRRFTRTPDFREFAWRMAIWGSPAVAATVGTLWTIRRLNSRRHTEPPVG